jgi:hypothetical protein
MAAMVGGDFAMAARLIGCEEQTARDVHFMFGDLSAG